MGYHILRQEQWIPEWKNSSRIEARIDLTITNFGKKKPAHGDYTIRSIDVIQLRHIESALWQLQSDARTLFWNAWLKLMHDAGKAMIDDHPLRSPAGHHIINAEFFHWFSLHLV